MSKADKEIRFVVAIKCPSQEAFEAIWRNNLAKLMAAPDEHGNEAYAVSMIDLFQQVDLVEKLIDTSVDLDCYDRIEAIGDVLAAVDPVAAAQEWLR